MKSFLSLFLMSVFAASLALPQAGTPAPKKATAPKTAPKAAPKSTPKTTTTATKKAVTKKSATTKGGKKAGPPAQTWRNRQLAPTKARYQEIQQALADKGYLKQEPNGIWDSQSEEALKQFQTEKNLPPTGKITSMSLIGLGLGPKPPEPITVPPNVPEATAPPLPTPPSPASPSPASPSPASPSPASPQPTPAPVPPAAAPTQP